MIIVGENSSGVTLSACLSAREFENKMWEWYAANKMYAKIILEQAATELKLGKS